MITGDQFTNLPSGLRFVFSARQDGTVLDRSRDIHAPDLIKNRQAICQQAELSYADMVYQRIVYGDDATYDVLVEVDGRHTTQFTPDVTADGLFTKQAGVGLFLPVADCIVTVLYDPKRRLLAQLHMGRHSTLTHLLSRTVARFVSLGAQPGNILVWMAPAATKASYVLDYFEHEHDVSWQGYVEKKPGGYYLDLQGYNRAALIREGVAPEHITISSIDTMQDARYFSHARGDVSGRFAGIAMMT